MTRLIYIVLVGFLLILENSLSQPGNGNSQKKHYNGVIKGQVLEVETHKPLSFSNVTVYRVGSEKLVDGIISDKDGNFVIDNLPDGSYYILVKFIGYEKKKVNTIVISEDKPVYDLGKIELNFTNYKSDGVEVTAEKPLVEFKMDKKVVNVNRDIISQGGTAVDALQNVPSVKVDVEGNVTLRGSSNFQVFINGKPSVLTGSDALEQIPASTIENIEIITNPSAKNDPDGVGGIINVVLKKDAELGLTGIFDISVGTRDKYSANALINYHLKSFNFFTGFDFKDDIRHSTGNAEALYFDSLGNDIRDQKSEIAGSRNHSGNTFKTGIAFDIDEKNSIALEGSIGSMDFERRNNSDMKQWLNTGVADSFFVNKTIGAHDNNFYNVNLSYNHYFNKTGHQLTALLFYSNSNGTGRDSQEDFIADSIWKKINKSNDNTKSLEDESSYNIRFKTDYVLPINENDKFEAGYQMRLEPRDEKFSLNQFLVDSNRWENNPLFSNSMSIKEDIHAIYTTYSAKISSLSFLAGIRGEYTFRKIDVIKAEEPFKIDRFDWFPSLHLVQDLGTSQQITASYSRRIERPDEWDLDPFPTYMNANTYRIGNPDLGPEFTDSYELGYQKYFGVSYISLESYYRITSDKITRVRSLDGELIRLTSTNLNKDYTLGVELTANYEPFKWLRVNASTSYYNYKLEGQVFEDEILKSTNVWDANFNLTLMLSQDTRLQTNGFYSGPTITAQGKDEGRLSWNAALRQDFWNKTASLTLQIRDLLGTMKREFSSKDALLYNRFYMDFESPVVSLAFSYKLNNYQKKKEPTNGEGGFMDEGF